MAVMAVWAAVLLLIGSSMGMPTLPQVSGGSQTLISSSLDMAPDSVDDMYRGCQNEMVKKINTRFVNDEINHDAKFGEAWRIAEKYYNTKWKGKSSLKKEEIMAIYAYTLATPNLYLDFNNAVQTQKREYTTTFAYHTLHFYLTSAIKALNREEKCFTSYRRVNREFRTNLSSKRIRFGAFTSSSVGSYADSSFGDKTCFEINTCYGADISKYSEFENEREALIPPYEVFEVTKMEKRSEKKDLPCEVVYHVWSTGETVSSLNCAFFKKKRTRSNYSGFQ